MNVTNRNALHHEKKTLLIVKENYVLIVAKRHCFKSGQNLQQDPSFQLCFSAWKNNFQLDLFINVNVVHICTVSSVLL